MNFEKLKDVLEQADEYLNVTEEQKKAGVSNYIGTGSILHSMMKEALGRPKDTTRNGQEEYNCMLCGSDVQGRFLFCDNECESRYTFFTGQGNADKLTADDRHWIELTEKALDNLGDLELLEEPQKTMVYDLNRAIALINKLDGRLL